jgi:hypothetical protein
VQRVRDGQFVTLKEAEESDEFFSGAKIFQILSALAAAACFIWWLRRATANLPSLGCEDIRYGTGWAVGGWFVPILSLWRPYQVAAQAWRGSDPDLPTPSSRHWRNAMVSPIVPFWWTVYVIAWFIWGITNRVRASEDLVTDVSAARNALIFTLVSDLVMIGSAALAVVFVAMLTARQRHANARLDVIGHSEAATRQESAGVFR